MPDVTQHHATHYRVVAGTPTARRARPQEMLVGLHACPHHDDVLHTIIPWMGMPMVGQVHLVVGSPSHDTVASNKLPFHGRARMTVGVASCSMTSCYKHLCHGQACPLPNVATHRALHMGRSPEYGYACPAKNSEWSPHLPRCQFPELFADKPGGQFPESPLAY